MATGSSEQAVHAPGRAAARSAAGAAKALRAVAVIFGGPLLLNLLMGAGVVGSIVDPLLPRPAPHRPAIVRRLMSLGALTAWVYTLVLRPWSLRWGATDEEVDRVLPGDELVPHPVWRSTRAVTIAAPAEVVWPWLAQIGQGRGGFYSYDWLENLAGLDIHSADRILPALQAPRLGDFIPAAPGAAKTGMGWTVVAVQPGRALVLRAGPPNQALAPAADVPFVSTWAFVVEPRDEGSARLLARGLIAARSRLLALAGMAMMELPYFIMERRMLLGIKARAERSVSAA
jgi:hypothetical protein